MIFHIVKYFQHVLTSFVEGICRRNLQMPYWHRVYKLIIFWSDCVFRMVVTIQISSRLRQSHSRPYNKISSLTVFWVRSFKARVNVKKVLILNLFRPHIRNK